MKKFPDQKCPACGSPLVPEVGFPRMDKLHGYLCMAFGCVGFKISREELCDPERYPIIVAECVARKKSFDEMLIRNGAHTRGWKDRKDRWCVECHAYHPPTAEHPECRLCSFAIHAPMPLDIMFRDYKGWNFSPPFVCMCCGKEICFTQWAYGRSCGPCDTGACQKKRLHARMDVVFYGNGEMVDPTKAAKYRFMPDRMVKVPPGKPAQWFKP